jgi:hypothetical protein
MHGKIDNDYSSVCDRRAPGCFAVLGDLKVESAQAARAGRLFQPFRRTHSHLHATHRLACPDNLSAGEREALMLSGVVHWSDCLTVNCTPCAILQLFFGNLRGVLD